jgi:hypothetical protein
MRICRRDVLHAHVADNAGAGSSVYKDRSFYRSQSEAIICDRMETLSLTILASALCAIMAAGRAEAAVLTKGLPAFNVIKVWALSRSS